MMKSSERKRSALDESDGSDSDDSLLNFGLARKRRSTTTSRSKSSSAPERILGNALADIQKNLDKQRRMATAKKGDDNADDDDSDDDEDMEKAKKMLEESKKKKTKSKSSNNGADENQYTPDGRVVSQLDDGPDLDSEDHLVMVTAQTDLFGIRRADASSFTSIGCVPKLNYQVYSRLKLILDNDEAKKKNDQQQIPPKLLNALRYHLENGTLHLFLTSPLFWFSCGGGTRGVAIPTILLDWLMEVAIAFPSQKDQMDSLCLGAYLFLVTILENPKGYLHRMCRFSIRDFPVQLEKLLEKEGNPKSSSDVRNPNQPSSKSCTLLNTIATSRFLQLWELAFVNGRVNVDADHASMSIVRLLILGLDTTFASKTTSNGSPLSSIQRILNEILCIVSRECNDSKKFDEWLKTLLCPEILNSLSSSGNLSNFIDINDVDNIDTFLPPLVRSIRLIVTAECNSGKKQALQLGVNLSIDVLKSYLKVSDWDSEVIRLMDSWVFSTDLRTKTESIALASSVIASSKLLSMLSSSETKNACSGTLLCSVVEISHLCLQCSTSLLVWDDEFKVKGHKGNVGEAYESLEQICSQLAAKTNACVLSDPQLLRANYYVNAMRQYPRLMSKYYNSTTPKKKQKAQAKMDSFFKPTHNKSA